MAQWKPIVGLSFDAPGFDVYAKSLAWTSWRPSFITLHNTATPNLAQRPNGFEKKHIQNLVGYYRDTNGWSAGPHLFVDDRQIWVFTPLTTTGRHSPGFNQSAIGIEMLGDYATDSFDTGRGAAVRKNAVCAMASLCGALGLDPATIKLHKEDPQTTHDCPGKKVSKSAIIAEVKAALDGHYGGFDHVPADPHPDAPAAVPYSAAKPTDQGVIARAKELQKWLNDHEGAGLTVDGWAAKNTSDAYKKATGQLLPGDPRG